MARDKVIHDDALGRDDLNELYGWSPSAQQRARAAGEFPAEYHHLGGRVYWRRETVEAWIKEQEAKQQQGQQDGGE